MPAPRKGASVDEHIPDGNSTSTRCRYCGSDDRDDNVESVRERAHYQVVVACGSCGHAFAAISRN